VETTTKIKTTIAAQTSGRGPFCKTAKESKAKQLN
jgi:hypothetical protein